MRRTLPALLLLAPLAWPLQPHAQATHEVQFAPGDFGTMLSGTVTGHDYVDYKLAAQSGQTMFVELTVAGTDGTGSAYFNILPPGSDDVAIYIGSMDGNSTTLDLPDNGTYTIRVYLMGNDRDTDKTVDFNVDLSIQ